MAFGFDPNTTDVSSENEETNTVESLEHLEEDNTKSPVKVDKNKVFILIIGAVLVIFLILLFYPKKQPAQEETAGNVEVSEENEELSTANDTDLSLGTPNFESTTEEGFSQQNNIEVVASSDFIKDLRSVDIKADYSVAQIDYVKDFVNYEVKRAETSDGMELYWLHCIYKNKPYRVQVPYYVVQQMEPEGICVVEMEIVTTTEGNKLITFMQVITDYSLGGD